jgi:hypothetical protein
MNFVLEIVMTSGSGVSWSVFRNYAFLTEIKRKGGRKENGVLSMVERNSEEAC